jgi:hypothetical protein
MKYTALALSALLLGSVVVFAHGNEQHVIGTVSKIEANSITVATVAGPVTTVNIVPTTKFLKGDAAAALKDVKVGDRVVIHAKPLGKTLEASEVKIGVAAANTAKGSSH